MTDNTLAMMLIRHEGENKKGANHFPYKCPAGKITLGWGRNIQERGISDDEAMLMLHNDIHISYRELDGAFGWFEMLDGVRQMALADMHFNMGMTKLSKFINMIAAFAAKDYETAADEAKDSHWYNQVGARGREIVHMVRTGKMERI